MYNLFDVAGRVGALGGIVVLWSMVAAFAFSMFIIQVLLWTRSRDVPPALAAVMSLASAGSAWIEMSVAKTNDIAAVEFLTLMANAAIFFLVVPMIWFVHCYLYRDRTWLLYLITGLWTICLLINFVMPGNLTFSSLSSIQTNVTFWGETWYQPVGEANPLRWLSEFATILIIIYIADATIRSYRHGQLRKAATVGGAMLFFIVVAGVQTPLVDLNIIKTPYMVSWAFVAIALSLSVELVNQVSRSAILSKAVQASNVRWQTLMGNVEFGVIGTTGTGTVDYTNRYVGKLLGQDPDQIMGRNIVEYAPVSIRHVMQERIENQLLSPRTEFPLVDANGEIRNLIWATVPQRNARGEITGYMAIVEDVSALKKAETELRASERAIERFDRAAFLVELASGFAHELNQPLSAILNNAQAGSRMLEQDPVPLEEIAEIFSDIAQDDMRAGNVIRSMRRLLETSKLRAERSSLGRLVSEVRNILASELLHHDIKVTVDLPAALDDIHVGRIEIQQVIMNLMINAIRVLQADGIDSPTIAISACLVEHRVEISVVDNGPGVSADARQKIFEPFYSTRKDGLGMGLSISRRIVELHGGKLACRNTADDGTEFCFSVPLNKHISEAVDA
jgi:two-component system sensor kinase FixL